MIHISHSTKELIRVVFSDKSLTDDLIDTHYVSTL